MWYVATPIHVHDTTLTFDLDCISAKLAELQVAFV